MKTEFLKSLNLSQEVIDKIMAENGKDIAVEQKKAEKAKADADKQISQMKFDYALSAALTGAKAKNAKAVKALLDMDGLKFNDNDGKIVGLDEQLAQIKTDNDYLFESDEPAPEFVKGTNGGSGSVGGKKPSEMTYTELCDYMAQNPGAEI